MCGEHYKSSTCARRQPSPQAMARRKKHMQANHVEQCMDNAGSGDLAQLQKVLTGIPKTGSLTAFMKSPENIERLGHQAAKGGHVHILRHLSSINPCSLKFEEDVVARVCGTAAAAGHIPVLDWARSQGHSRFQDALSQACLHRCGLLCLMGPDSLPDFSSPMPIA